MPKWSLQAVIFLREHSESLTDEEISKELNFRYGMTTNILSVQRKRHRIFCVKPLTFRWEEKPKIIQKPIPLSD